MRKNNSIDIFLTFLNDYKEEIKEEIKNEILNEINNDNKKLYYSIKETSQILGLSFNAVKGRQRRNNIEVVYEGTTPLVPADEINRLLNKLESQRNRNKQRNF